MGHLRTSGPKQVVAKTGFPRKSVQDRIKR